MQTTLKTDNHGLTDYHHQRNKVAVKAVEQMLKHPLSHTQVKEQIVRLRAQKGK